MAGVETPDVPAGITVRRRGAANGDGLVIDVEMPGGPAVHGIGVEPAPGASRANGPTWAYVVEDEGVTLIDPGHLGSFDYLADGLAALGMAPRDIDRVVVSHGHWDHDGGVADLLDASGAEFWAHELWAAYTPYSYGLLLRSDGSPLRAEMSEIGQRLRDEARREGEGEGRGPGGGNRNGYDSVRSRLVVDRGIVDGDVHGAIKFLHTPGHWPDELTIRVGDLIFTGDHVLPEITPHPSMAYDHPADLARTLPRRYQDAGEVWGLAVYLRSLRRVCDMGTGLTVLPAHRLFNRGEFRMTDESRAGETIAFHMDRCDRLMEAIEGGHSGLEPVTREVFSYRPLRDVYNLMSAISETISHIELLEKTGDVAVASVEGSSGVRLELTGSRNYREFIGGLTPGRAGTE